ncbi:MAG: hypothetical protein IPG51_04745 [Chloroflexi bacterium]|nr:hypothetical protein [Chloroflexota bacterium]
MFWGDVGAWFGASWVVLALAQLGVGGVVDRSSERALTGLPPQLVAHGLAIVGLMTGVLDPAVSSVSVGLVILFYLGRRLWIGLMAEGADQACHPICFSAGRFAAAVGHLPVPVVMARVPEPAVLGLVALGFVLPLLAIGRRLARWEPAYRWPFICRR